jgi:hypothetical protein
MAAYDMTTSVGGGRKRSKRDEKVSIFIFTSYT